MAFFGKIGKLLNHSAVRKINHGLSSVSQATRSMSSTKLFVEGMLVFHVEFSKWSVAIIFQISITMQVFRIKLMKLVSENFLLAMGKFLMVIFFPTLTIH